MTLTLHTVSLEISCTDDEYTPLAWHRQVIFDICIVNKQRRTYYSVSKIHHLTKALIHSEEKIKEKNGCESRDARICTDWNFGRSHPSIMDYGLYGNIKLRPQPPIRIKVLKIDNVHFTAFEPTGEREPIIRL